LNHEVKWLTTHKQQDNRLNATGVQKRQVSDFRVAKSHCECTTCTFFIHELPYGWAPAVLHSVPCN